MIDNDALVSDYLGRLEAAASGLPAEQRAELIEEISAHIADARALSATSVAGPEYDLLDLLGRLGDPEEIVSAYSAADGPAPGRRGPAGAGPPGSGPPGSGPPGSGPPGSGPLGSGTLAPAGLGGVEIAAVILTMGFVFLLPFVKVAAAAGWLVGVTLLWYSPRWRTMDKVLGTIVWPLGIGLAALLAALHGSHHGGLFALIRLLELGATIAAVIVVAVRLLRHAGQASA